MITKLIIASVIIFIFNIPFGYWRANVRKFSLQWILAVHIPVPFIIALRILVSIGFAWYTYVFFVAAFFTGQSFGAYLLKIKKRHGKQTSSCLIMDIVRSIELYKTK
ncbi:MAG: hypothetical protein QM503_04205 [Bacteroidota bacterium]